MVVEELVAKLGFRATGASEAAKFLKQLEKIKRAMKEAAKGGEINLRGGGGIGRLAREYDRAAASARRFRHEADRAARAGSGYGGGGLSRGGGRFTRSEGRRGGREFGQGLGEGAGLGAGGRALGIGAAGYAVGAEMKRATNESIEFERKLIEVDKAVDGSGQSLPAYKERLLSLSRATGKTKEELAEILTAAGKAGRPAQELERFTEFAAKTTVAWGLSADETGQNLAQLGTIYEATQKRLEGMADAINVAADASASSEGDLLNFVARTGASGKAVGMAIEDILPFGVAMKEVGVRTDVAATAFEALLGRLKLGNLASKKAGEGLQMLGINSTRMRRDFVKNPFDQALKLLQKIKEVKDPLKQAEIMDLIFGGEYQDDITKLLNGLEQIKKYRDILRDRKNYQGKTVEDQFSKASTFDASKIDRGQRAREVLETRAGDLTKGILAQAADNFSSFVERIETSANILSRVTKVREGYNSEPGTQKPVVTLDDVDPQFAGVRKWFDETATGIANYILGTPGKAAEENAAAFLQGKNAARRDLGLAPMASSRQQFGSLSNRMNWMGAAGQAPSAIGPGSLGQRANWLAQGAQATSSVTNNYTDSRSQSVTINQTVNGVPGVASAAAEGAKSGLSSMGASVVKGNLTATGASASP